jgi:hypothetical protein
MTKRVFVARTDEPSQPGSTSRPAGRSWPSWAQVAMSVALLYHLGAILAGAMAVSPSSEIERRAVEPFRRYYELINQGYGYRYYSRLDATVDPHRPRPWGTPVVTAEMEFERPEGGKTTEVLRIPGLQRLSPRLRHQRQLDLAYHLSADPRWAASYARHLCKTRGCSRVTIYTQEHHIPDLALVREAASRGDASAVDLEAASTYSPRVKLGEFRCADF